MEAPGGTGIVKTALQTQEFVKPVVENLIQVLSQVESVGNLIYTRALLKQFHDHSKIEARWLDQTTVRACMRIVVQPENFKFKPENQRLAIVNSYEALAYLKNSTFETTLKGFSQLINAKARQYRTSLVNNLFMRLEQWLTKTLKLQLESQTQKPPSKNTVRVLRRTLMKQKLQDGDSQLVQLVSSYSSILDVHKQFLQQEIYQLEVQSSWEGLLQDKLIQNNAHMYLSY
jgi:hypothetical protein